MNIIIIGDKYQKGMKSKGCPALISINKKTNILENQYKILKDSFPNSNIIYIGGFESKKIQNYLLENKNIKLELVINTAFNDYHEINSLCTVLEHLNTDILIISGYHVFNNKAFKNFNKLIGSQIFISKDMKNDIGCIISNDTIKNIALDLPNSLTNIYYISKADIEVFKDYINNIKFKNYFLFEIINNLIDKSTIFKPHFMNNTYIYDK